MNKWLAFLSALSMSVGLLQTPAAANNLPGGFLYAAKSKDTKYYVRFIDVKGTILLVKRVERPVKGKSDGNPYTSLMKVDCRNFIYDWNNDGEFVTKVTPGSIGETIMEVSCMEAGF